MLEMIPHVVKESKMHKIICPKCNYEFNIKDSEYNSILNQIEEAEIKARVDSAVCNEKENIELKYELKLKEVENESKSKEAEYKNKLENAKKAIDLQVNKRVLELRDEIHQKDNEIALINEKLKNTEDKHKAELAQEKLKSEVEIKNLNAQLDLAKDYKMRLSTKGIGEDLEKYCINKFEDIRPVAFKNAYFEKDTSKGQKGDFIFRDFDDFGVEIVSIMFEMKNESDTTKTKKTNAEFYQKLNSDRNEKKCEYAVLVSMLEKDNDFFNNGIVDVSYKSGYEKMYVCRPQNFITIISLLRNAALKSLELKNDIEKYKEQNIDVENFENRLKEYQNTINKHYVTSAKAYKDAIKRIDDMIENLGNIRDSLQKSSRQLGYASGKAEEITIRKLTSSSPSLAKEFKKVKSKNNKN